MTGNITPTTMPHADVVGSLLRPADLIAAQELHALGHLTSTEFKSIEDQAVNHAIAVQESAGLKIVTDGEMRRLSFQSQVPASLEGFGEYDLDAFLWGDWYGNDHIGNKNVSRPSKLGVISKLRRKAYLATEEFLYLREHTSEIPKITIPSPSLFANFWSTAISSASYPKVEHFLSDVADMIRADIQSLRSNGATYIQFDAPHYPLILDPTWADFYESIGWSATSWVEFGVELDNAVMQGFDDVLFAIHLCRGNQGSRWLTQGGYERLLAPVLQRTKASRLMLEYDDHRSGTFDVLKEVPKDKTVVLGLVTTKEPGTEAIVELTSRIKEASQHFPIEQLALSPQCGFGTSVIGNSLSLSDQIEKLQAVVQTAEAVWA